MRKKKDEQYQKEREHFEYVNASTVSEAFPGVEAIEIVVKFKEPDWGSDPSDQKLEFSRDSKAIFKLSCPHVECIQGGFNFSNVIRDMVSLREEGSQGAFNCQGWQDRERINKHKCLLNASYRIRITYHRRGDESLTSTSDDSR